VVRTEKSGPPPVVVPPPSPHQEGTALTTTTSPRTVASFPAESPRAWFRCGDNCGASDPGACCAVIPHIVIWPEGGELCLGTECAQNRFVASTAGYLAFAGVPLRQPFHHETGQIIITIDPGWLEIARIALNGAGANVTVFS
jgi:hypothetical protein